MDNRNEYNRQILNFTDKWIKKFQKEDIYYTELVEHYFADDCKELGFDMDVFQSFKEKYDEMSNYPKNQWLETLKKENDPYILGCVLYSEWRYFNHWAWSGTEILLPENRNFFIVLLTRLQVLAETTLLERRTSTIELIKGSCVEQHVDVVVNAANRYLYAGGGVCGAIFQKAGIKELAEACKEYKTPLNDGDAVMTPAFHMENAKAIIHAVGPDFGIFPHAFKELFDAYYNSLSVMMKNGYHSISFPLISSGIYGGFLDHPVEESTKQCYRAYKKFKEEYPDYKIKVLLCAYSVSEYEEAKKEFNKHFNG